MREKESGTGKEKKREAGRPVTWLIFFLIDF